MNLISKLKKVTRDIKRYGGWHLIRLLSWRLPHSVMYFSHTMLMRMENTIPKRSKVNPWEVRQATIDDLEILKSVKVTPEQFTLREKCGYMSFIAVKDGKAVSLDMVATGEVYMPNNGIIFDTGSDGFYLYGGYTVPEERSKGCHRAVSNHILDYFYDHGKTTIFSNVDMLNEHSLKVVTKKGFNVAGESIYLRFLGFNICYYKKWPYPTKKLQLHLGKFPKGVKVLH